MWQSVAEFRAVISEDSVQKKERTDAKYNIMAFYTCAWASIISLYDNGLISIMHIFGPFG